MDVTKLSLEANIELMTPSGEPISLQIQEILWNPEEPGCLMYGLITLQQWNRVWAEGLFQLSPEVVLQDLIEFEEEDGLITLELSLDTAVLETILSGSADPLETFLSGLGGTTEESALVLSSSNWRAHSVLQEIAVPDDPDAILQVGFQTIWARQ